MIFEKNFHQKTQKSHWWESSLRTQRYLTCQIGRFSASLTLHYGVPTSFNFHRETEYNICSLSLSISFRAILSLSKLKKNSFDFSELLLITESHEASMRSNERPRMLVNSIYFMSNRTIWSYFDSYTPLN